MFDLKSLHQSEVAGRNHVATPSYGTKARAAVTAITIGFVISTFSGCSSSPYSVDYTLDSGGGFYAGLKVTVKGPAAKLAVILTDPKGESETQIITKENMIGNSQTVELPMQNPRAGTYILTVKTVEPEKIVWQKSIPFSLGQLAVTDVTFDFSPNLGPRFEGSVIDDIKVVLTKDGNLPVSLMNARPHSMAKNAVRIKSALAPAA